MSIAEVTSAPRSPAQERRSFARRQPDRVTYVRLDRDNGGIVVDLSEGGLNFQGVAGVMENEPCELKFSLPGSGNRLQLRGEIAWSNETKKGGGVRFVNLPDEARQQIREWVTPSSRLRAVETAASPSQKFVATAERLAMGEIPRPVETVDSISPAQKTVGAYFSPSPIEGERPELLLHPGNSVAESREAPLATVSPAVNEGQHAASVSDSNTLLEDAEHLVGAPFGLPQVQGAHPASWTDLRNHVAQSHALVARLPAISDPEPISRAASDPYPVAQFDAAPFRLADGFSESEYVRRWSLRDILGNLTPLSPSEVAVLFADLCILVLGIAVWVSRFSGTALPTAVESSQVAVANRGVALGTSPRFQIDVRDVNDRQWILSNDASAAVTTPSAKTLRSETSGHPADAVPLKRPSSRIVGNGGLP